MLVDAELLNVNTTLTVACLLYARTLPQDIADFGFTARGTVKVAARLDWWA